MSLDLIYSGHWLHSSDSDTTTGIVRSSVTRIMRMEREYFVVRIGIQLLDFHFFLSWPSLLLLSVFYDINQQNQSLWYCHYSLQSISSSSNDHWLFVFSPQGMSRDCLRSRDPGQVISLSLWTLSQVPDRPLSPDFATLLVTTHQRHRDVDTIWHPQQHANTTQPHVTSNLSAQHFY